MWRSILNKPFKQQYIPEKQPFLLKISCCSMGEKVNYLRHLNFAFKSFTFRINIHSSGAVKIQRATILMLFPYS